jgi:hypothetical protein
MESDSEAPEVMEKYRRVWRKLTFQYLHNNAYKTYLYTELRLYPTIPEYQHVCTEHIECVKHFCTGPFFLRHHLSNSDYLLIANIHRE